jgi:putative DNA primase/helicase
MKYDELYPDGNDGTVASGSNIIAFEDAAVAAKSKRASTAKQDAQQRDAAQRVLPAPTSPMAVARAFVADKATRGGQLTLRSWRGSWWRWRTTQWDEVEDREIREELYRFTEHAEYETDKGPKPWAPNRNKIADLVDALAAVCFLAESVQAPAWITRPGTAREFVSVANGLLQIGTRELRVHTPDFFNLTSVPFNYDAAAEAPKRWSQFLEELWPDDAESAAALQEYLGYVLSGRTDLHKILGLVGPTRAGKGVIGRVAKSLVGHGNHCGPTLASLATNFGLAPLIGKPLAIVADARLGGANVHQVVERLLSISGEDVLTVDRKYREQWTGTLPTRFIIITNELPRFGDASGAIANRFLMLVLTESWLHRENTNLTKELLDELPGILNWALDGLEALNARGRFIEPKASTEAIVALQDLVSPVAAFVRDRCEQGPHEIPCKTLWEQWKLWAEDNGHRPGSNSTFGRDLRAVIPALRVIRPRDGDRERLYRGVRTRVDNDRSTGPGWTAPDDETDAVQDGPADQPLSAQLKQGLD